MYLETSSAKIAIPNSSVQRVSVITLSENVTETSCADFIKALKKDPFAVKAFESLHLEVLTAALRLNFNTIRYTTKVYKQKSFSTTIIFFPQNALTETGPLCGRPAVPERRPGRLPVEPGALHRPRGLVLRQRPSLRRPDAPLVHFHRGGLRRGYSSRPG